EQDVEGAAGVVRHGIPFVLAERGLAPDTVFGGVAKDAVVDVALRVEAAGRDGVEAADTLAMGREDALPAGGGVVAEAVVVAVVAGVGGELRRIGEGLLYVAVGRIDKGSVRSLDAGGESGGDGGGKERSASAHDRFWSSLWERPWAK